MATALKGPFTARQSERICGTCPQRRCSPKGGIEGALVKVKGAVVQVSVHPDAGAALARITGPGQRPRALAVDEHSPKTADGAHPAYPPESRADAAGLAIEWPDAELANTSVKGVVAALHCARQGQPNSVMRETGKFIHLRPRGMALLGFGAGAKITAVGTLRMTALGTRLLEAHQVNRIALE